MDVGRSRASRSCEADIPYDTTTERAVSDSTAGRVDRRGRKHRAKYVGDTLVWQTPSLRAFRPADQLQRVPPGSIPGCS